MDTILSKNKSNVLKFIAVVLMILFHTFAFSERIEGYSYISLLSINNVPFEFYISKIGQICVSIFIFLSGYGMYIKYGNQKKVYRNIFEKLFRFYLNYCTVFLIFIPLGIIMGKYSFNLKYLLLNFIGIKSSYNGEWWFVRLYVMLLILYPIFKYIVNKFNVYFVLIFSFIINILGFIITKISIILSSDSIIIELIAILLGGQFLFLFGMCIAKYSFFNKMKMKLKFNKNKYILFSFILIILIQLLINVRIIGKISELILVPILCFFIANGISNNNKLSELGKYSTNMWLTHSFFIYYLFPNITFRFKYSILILLWVIIISFICSYLVSKLVYLELKFINFKNKK